MQELEPQTQPFHSKFCTTRAWNDHSLVCSCDLTLHVSWMASYINLEFFLSNVSQLVESDFFFRELEFMYKKSVEHVLCTYLHKQAILIWELYTVPALVYHHHIGTLVINTQAYQ